MAIALDVERTGGRATAGGDRPSGWPFLVAVASFEERMYELGSEALAEQERQVAEVRGRGATLLAAGAVIASLLAKPVFDGEHPHGFAEIAATAIGLLGSAGILVFVVLLLRPYELGFSVKAGVTYRALWEQAFSISQGWISPLPRPSRSAGTQTPRSSGGWCCSWP
jgi:hypothetical protein